MGDRDVTERIERSDALEQRAGVRLVSISAFWEAEINNVQVSGELYPREGDSIDADISLEVTIYDDRQRVVAKERERVRQDDFFAFHTFSFGVQVPEPVQEVGKIRLLPRVSRLESNIHLVVTDDESADLEEEEDE